MGTHFASTTAPPPPREHAGFAARSRAESLFAPRRVAGIAAEAGGGRGAGAGVVGGDGAEVGGGVVGGVRAGEEAWRAASPHGSREESGREPPWRPSWRVSLREAVCERLPVWVQLRCGMELRTVAAVAGVLVLAMAFAVHHFWAGRPRAVRVPPVARGTAMAPAAHALVSAPARTGPVPAASAGPPPSGGVVVDVTGKVRRPGVQRLPAGSRVTDALKAAGGPLPGADTSALNLARPLADGEQVVVGRPPGAGGLGGGAGGTGGGGPVGAIGGQAPGAAAAPVSLSTATPEQLDALPGVGPVLARHILEYRAQHGGFTSVGQLRQVSGVGDRRFKDLAPLVRP